MPAITYTALRSITRTSFETLVNTGISVTSTGSPNVSTFNDSASPGNLSGLLNAQWIYVAGFTTAVNNGWHQVSGTSSANGIVVTTILTAEAAGNSIEILGYLRGSEQSYSIDVRFTADDRQRQVTKIQSVALSGNTETLTQRREDFFNITSQVLDTTATNYDQFIEFLDSCESGETFDFDRVGSVATPVDPRTCRIDGNGYTEQRLENITDRRISFRIRADAI